MYCFVTSSSTGTWATSDILDTCVRVMCALAKGRLDSRLCVRPGTHVHRLFLSPDHLGVGEVIRVLVNQIEREWRDLLHTCDCDISDALLVEIVHATSVSPSRHAVLRAIMLAPHGVSVRLHVGVRN